MNVAQAIAVRIAALENCRKTSNHEWIRKHTDGAAAIALEYLPSGSGIDVKPQIDFLKSTGEKIVIHFSYHHMDEYGGYDGWTDHTVTVRASLVHDIDIRIGGRDRNDVKEYLHQVFHDALTTEIQS